MANAGEGSYARRSRNSASAWSPTARWARASSRARSTRTRRSTAPISAARCPALRPEALKANQALVDLLGTIATRGERRRPLRSRSRGCWPRSRGSFRSPARRSCIGWMRTSGQLIIELTPAGSREIDQRRVQDHGARGAVSREAGANDRSLNQRKVDSDFVVHFGHLRSSLLRGNNNRSPDSPNRRAAASFAVEAVRWEWRQKHRSGRWN